MSWTDCILIIAPCILIPSWIWLCWELYNAPLLDDEDWKETFKDLDI